MEKYTGLEIAVIGISCRFPGSRDAGHYWANLCAGVEGIKDFSKDDALRSGELMEVVEDSRYVTRNGYLEDKGGFDAGFFGYRPAEAELMDPQVRIFHECCWKAIEDGGYNVEDLDRVGVFSSGSPNVGWIVHAELKNRSGAVDEFSASQLRDVSFLSSRISYKLNLRGPSLYIQTACSSSLVSIHEACNSLLLGECNMALAGGVNVQSYSRRGYVYKEGLIRSRDGHCRPFDKDSSGTVNGEGVGVVLLKRLKDAIEGGDHIYAVVKGSAINNDGQRKVGYTAPSVSGQVEVIRKAHKVSGVSASRIGYVEAHGTATDLGDTLEMEALHKVFSGLSKDSCGLGSVKSNIGHLDSAAGVAGFIKTVLSLYHKQIPASLHYREANPKIDFTQGPFYVNTSLRAWSREDGLPLCAGVSSFGIGGTNAHVVLEQAPQENKKAPDSVRPQLLLVSGKSSWSLDNNLVSLSGYLHGEDSESLSDICYTLQRGRVRFGHRAMLVGEEKADVLQKLDAGMVVRHEGTQQAGPIVFMFSGQGSQYVGMFKDLYQKEKIFRDKMDECLGYASSYSASDFRSVFLGSDDSKLNDTRYTQVILFMVEYSLTALLGHWGIRPQYMIGHSIGEYVAACVSGVLSLRDSIRIVIRRGELMGDLPGGVMLSVEMSESMMRSKLKHHQGVDLSVINSGSSVVVSSGDDGIAGLESSLSKEGYKSKRVSTSHGFHSYMMDGIKETFEKEFCDIEIGSPRIPYVSNVSGEFVTHGQVNDGKYWSSHLREAVRFHDGIQHLMDQGAGIYVEVGPGRTLCRYVEQIKDQVENSSTGIKVMNLVRQERQQISDVHYLVEKLGYLWLYGVDVDWSGYYKEEQRRRVSLPTYCFQHQDYTSDINISELLSGSVERAVKEQEATRLYTSGWRRTQLLGSVVRRLTNQGCIVIFRGSSEDYGDFLKEYLELHGVEVIEVRPGMGYVKCDNKVYEVGTCDGDSLQDLWSDLKGKEIDGIIYCGCLSRDVSGISHDEMLGKLKAGYLGLGVLGQSLWGIKQGDGIHVMVLGNHLGEILPGDEVDPLKSVVHSIVRLLPSEMSGVRSRVVDIPYPFRDDLARDFYTIQLEKELYDGQDRSFVGYRERGRWIEHYYEQSQEALQEAAGVESMPDAAGFKLRSEGVYLITGGLGGIGLSLCKDIVQRYGCRVIVVYRSEYIQELEQIRELIKAGYQISAYQGDVSEASSVSHLSSWISSMGWVVNGIIWSVGEIDYGGIMLNRKEDGFLKYSKGKIEGLLLFEKYFRLGELDFLCMFSSISNVLYRLKFGQVGYMAGNLFAEHYSHYVRSRYGIHSFTINWCDWLDVGLTVKSVKGDRVRGNKEKESKDSKEQINAQIYKGIHPGEGLRIFYKCLAGDSSVYNVYKGSLEGEISQQGNVIREVRSSLAGSALHKDVNHGDVGDDVLGRLIKLYGEFFGRTDIGQGSNFFELGGDSLKALSLIGRINGSFGSMITLSDLYSHATLKEMEGKLAEEKGQGKPEVAHVIDVCEHQEHYVSSSQQRRMYFLQMLEPGSTLYNETEILDIEGSLDVDRVEEVFKALIHRHEGLRTSFRIIDGEVRQVISDSFNFKVSRLPEESTVESFIRAFDLREWPILRVGVQWAGIDRYKLIIDSHHIVLDGMSRLLLREEFGKLYRGDALPQLRIQYKDYAVWQHRGEHSGVMEKDKAYWQAEYSQEVERTDLPLDYSRDKSGRHGGDYVRCVIDGARLDKLRELSAHEGTTVFTVLLSAVSILLSRITNSEDVVIGVPVGGRPGSDLDGIVGMFVNTLALRHEVKGQLSYRSYLQEVKRRSVESFQHGSYPFEELVQLLNLDRDVSRNPLFDVMLVYQRYENSGEKVKGLEIRSQNIRHNSSRLDLTVLAVEEGDRMKLRFIYSTDLFKASTINRLVGYFERIIDEITGEESPRICDIEILSDVERHQLLVDFNDTKEDYVLDKSVVDLFEQQVERTPDNIALIHGRERITYRQLNNLANRIAIQIEHKLKGEKNRICVLFNPSTEMVASMLAILKCGCAYVPLSLDNSASRNEYIYRDCNAKLTLVQEEFIQEERNFTFVHPDCVIVVGSKDQYELDDIEDINRSHPGDAMYVIYTSGTSGNPKGVEIKNRGIINMLHFHSKLFGIRQGTRTSQIANIGFDASAFEIWPSLIGGGLLFIASAQVRRDPELLKQWLVENRIEVVFLTTTIAEYVLYDEKLIGESNVKLINVAGDRLKYVPKRELPYKLFNLYGPTEDSVWTTWIEITSNMAQNKYTVGKPISNKTILILNKDQKLQPIGVQGELCISGEGLASGYINNEVLTAEKFVQNPFDNSQRMYRTGDLASWMDDGNIEYLGRIDSQVKIRGFRVEPEGIEAHLLGHELISECVVNLINNEGNKFLVAYYVSAIEIELSSLRAYLSERLPDYMMPAYYVRLQNLPITPNGKVDRKSLPYPAQGSEHNYVAPCTTEEKLLVKIWEKVLGVPSIGLTDNFFFIGGDSIKSIQISARLRAAGYSISVKDMFSYQNVKELALRLKSIQDRVDQSPVVGHAPKSPVQRWFFDNVQIDAHHFNQSILLGFNRRLSRSTVVAVFEKIVEHHDALRTVFPVIGDEINQYTQTPENSVFSVEEFDLASNKLQEKDINILADELQSGFDIEKGPMVKLGLFQLSSGSRLLVAIHHLVVDVVSWRILLEDIDLLLSQVAKNEPFHLPMKTDSYQQWSKKVDDYSRSVEYAKARAYWQSILHTDTAGIERDYSGENSRISKETELICLDEVVTSWLVGKANVSFNTKINDLLLSALMMSINKKFGVDRVRMDMEGHGREEIVKDVNVSRTVGWFTSIFPVFLKVENEISSTIIGVKESLRHVPNNGLDYLIYRYSGDFDETTHSNSQISFNYLGQFDSDTASRSFEILRSERGQEVSEKIKRNYDLEILGMVTAGRLEMSVTFSTQQYAPATMKGFIQFFKEALTDVAQYCCSRQFAELTPSDLTYKLLTIDELQSIQSRNCISDIYLLSPMQEGMLFHSLVAPRSGNYFGQMSFQIVGNLNIGAIEQSMNVIMDRYDILRTLFLHDSHQRPLQVVLKERQMDFTFLDIREQCLSNSTKKVVLRYQIEDKARGFDLSQDVLTRLVVLQTGDTEFSLLWSYHHILMDGWCTSIIFEEFMKIYRAITTNQIVNLPPTKRYVQYIQWLEGMDKQAAREYWRNILAEYDNPVSLPKRQSSGHSRDQSREFAFRDLIIDHERTAVLGKISREMGVTTNTIVRVAWAILLGKYNNVKDVVFGSVISGRPPEIEGIESMVGLFINTIPVRIVYRSEDSLEDILFEAQRSTFESERHQYFSLSEIQSQTGLGKELFDHIMVFENYPVVTSSTESTESDDASRFVVTNVHMSVNTNYDLVVVVVPGREIQIKIEFNLELYDELTIERALVHFDSIMNQVIQHSHALTQHEAVIS